MRTQIENKIKIKISDTAPDITKNSFIGTIIKNKTPFITTDKKEIILIMEEHAHNLIAKKMSNWALKFLNIKTLGILPLIKGEKLLGLITFSSESTLEKFEIERLLRFNTHATNVIEKKLNEQKLIKNEERLKLAMEGANDGLWDWNVLTNQTYFSPRWKSMLGYTEDEIKNVQESWEKLIHKDDKQRAIEVVNDYIKGKTENYESEFRLRHKNGSYVYILDRGIGIKDKSGKIIRMTGTHVDITERKKHQIFLEQITTSLSFKTGPSYFTGFTKFCCETFKVKYALVGYYHKHLSIVESISFFGNGKELGPYNYNIKNTPCKNVLDGSICIYPDKVRQKFPKDFDLQKFNIESYLGIPLIDAQNNAFGIIALLDDKPMINTEEKSFLLSILSSRTANELSRNLIDKKLRESEERYRGLFEKMHEGLLVTSNDNLILNVNKSFCKMVGYKEEELIGNSGYDLFHDNDIKSELINKIDQRKKGLAETYELEFITKSRKKIWTQVSSSPYYNDEGKFSGVISIISDISERKNHEFEIQKTVDELNKRNNELMQFNYIVSHNLRSPIANILGLISVVDLPSVNFDEKVKILDYIKSSAQKMDELVKDLSVILSTRSALNFKKENVSISEVILSIEATLEKQISESETTIKIELGKEAKQITSIKSYIESILYNLISNAIKYKSSKRRPIVTISTKIQGNNFVLSVEDNGIGIDIEKHSKELFGLYKRFDYNTEGKGLGLHMTKNQILALGGEIFVESLLDEGTEFIITFKLNEKKGAHNN